MIEYVIKRDGRKEPFSSEKFNKLTKWSSDITSDGEANVDWSELALDAVKRLYNGCTTDEILQALINACLDKDKEAHFYIAGKLLMSSIYKNLYDDVIPPSLEEHLEDMEDKGIYLNFLDYYTEEDITYLDSILNHSKDFTLTHSQVNQMRNKYLCTNKVTKELYETPQFMFMRVALAVCMYDDEEVRLNNVKEVYTYLSNFHLNLPTPMWTNLGTPHKTGTSCFPASAKVDLETIRKAISDVKVGDIVLTHEGNYQKVTHVLPREYEGKFVTLNTVAGYTDEFNCTFNHLIYAIKQRPSYDLKVNPHLYKPEWIQADNLRVGDYIKLGVNVDVEDFNYSVWDIIKNSQHLEEGYSLQEDSIVFLTSKDIQHKLKDVINNINLNSENIFRLFGYYLAEGCISKPSRDNGSTLLFTVGTKEQCIIEDITSILESFGCTVGVYHNSSDNSTKISTHSKVLIALFLELFGTGFNDKRLCSKVLKAPLNLQQELLVGLIRGGGSAVISGYQVTLANEELIYQIRYICLRNKLHFAVCKTKKLPKYGNHYATIRITMTAKDPLALKINKDLQKLIETKTNSGQNIMYREDGCFAKVRLISSYESSETVYDLTVENDHSFIVNGLSVHNCLVYTVKDSVDSLTAGDHISNIMTVAGAGIGNTIFTRSKKDPIQNGRLEHLGKIPYFRLLQANIQATMQSGARRGAATTYINCLDPEIRTLIHLRNPTSIEEERVDDIDYAFTFNSVFANKVKKNEDWMLISYQVAPDLWESMYRKDDQLFEQLFDKYFNDSSAQKTIIKARDLAVEFLSEQRETGRLYEYNSSNSNHHTPFKDSIYGSNLCVAPETLVLTKEGEFPIHTLQNKEVEVWNGEQWSKTVVRKTGENQNLLKVTISKGKEKISIECTPYHKFYTQLGVYEAKDLKLGMNLESWFTPEGDQVLSFVYEVEDLGRKDDTFCFTEPLRNRGTFNGIVTGNCNEVYLSTKPFNSVLELYKTEYEEGDGYLQTCNLCAINLNKNYTDEEYYDLAYWALRIIDYVIDHSEYKLPQIGVTTKKFRSAGVSFMNLAAYMAKNKLLYNSKEGLQHLHELAERHEYMLMKASLELSKEYGLAEWIHKTKYPEGWLPIDTYSRNVDNIVEPVYKYDWESLRKDIITNGGIHNCVLSTSVPGESSSLVSNSTNSLYPIRQAIVIKTGANSKNVFMAPEYEEYKDYYQIAWDLSDTDMTNVYAVVQKFIGQGISCDYYLDHSNPESKSAKKMLKDWLYRDHMGLKGKYYTNNKTSSGKIDEVEIGCGSGGCTL